MRPAPPTQPLPDDDAASSTEPSIALDEQPSRAGPRSGGRPRLVWFAAAFLPLAVAGLALWLLTKGSTPATQTASPAASPTVSPSAPPRPAFVFDIRSRPPAAPGKLKRDAAEDASVEIGARLSAFYDTVFMDPDTWKNGVPLDAWSVFDPSVADRAMKDAQAFTLADRAPGLITLSVSESSLDVKVLVDAEGKPFAAVAVVDFVAIGTLDSGQAKDVTNHASFLLGLKGGTWFVNGYLSVSTDVESSSDAPTGSPTPSASP
jgi:hypothetical protein